MSAQKKQRSAGKVSTARRPSSALAKSGDFAELVERVVAIVEEARSRVLRNVNSEMVLSNWHIGRELVEYVQRGEPRAEYGEQVLEQLSAQLQNRVGSGFSLRNLRYYRSFYLAYSDREPKVSGEFGTSLVPNPATENLDFRIGCPGRTTAR